MSNPTFREVLRCEIEKLNLNDMAMKYGLDDPRTIAQSNLVDKLVVKVQKERLAGKVRRAV